jgi:hypothetical protein
MQTSEPTIALTPFPSQVPTEHPTTDSPTGAPTEMPTAKTSEPTIALTPFPSQVPTEHPTTDSPTGAPTEMPTAKTSEPTIALTPFPSQVPTEHPTTDSPTGAPTEMPTAKTSEPTIALTPFPSQVPTGQPTTSTPTDAPSEMPSQLTHAPTIYPTTSDAIKKAVIENQTPYDLILTGRWGGVDCSPSPCKQVLIPSDFQSVEETPASTLKIAGYDYNVCVDQKCSGYITHIALAFADINNQLYVTMSNSGTGSVELVDAGNQNYVLQLASTSPVARPTAAPSVLKPSSFPTPNNKGTPVPSYSFAPTSPEQIQKYQDLASAVYKRVLQEDAQYVTPQGQSTSYEQIGDNFTNEYIHSESTGYKMLVDISNGNKAAFLEG